MIPSEEKCKDCAFYAIWSGVYGGGAGYPACNHPGSGPRVVNLLSEMDSCPKE